MPTTSSIFPTPANIAPSPCSGSPLLLAASPRSGGNSDTAARLFAQGFAEVGMEVTPVFLRDYQISPCVSCNACSRAARAGTLSLPRYADVAATSCPAPHSASRVPGLLPFGCPQTLKDDSAPLLHALLTASCICIVTPIYFYHVPAMLKALIDRTQPFWALTETADVRLASLPARRCHIILIAARKQGEQLFTGTLLTLKQVFKPLHVHMENPLLLRGLDACDDLTARPDIAQSVIDYGRAAVLCSDIAKASSPSG